MEEMYALSFRFLTCASLFCFSDSLVSISTPNKESYKPLEPEGISIQAVSSIIFRVKAKNDVHVGLYPGTSSSPVPAYMYEIVIGGWSNTQSVIRKRQQGTAKASKSHSPLSQTEFKPFWVSWENGVRIGTGSVVGNNEFMFLEDNSYNVKYIALFTAWGSTGEWQFDDYPLLPPDSSIISTSSIADRISSVSETTSYITETTSFISETTSFISVTSVISNTALSISDTKSDLLLSTSFVGISTSTETEVFPTRTTLSNTPQSQYQNCRTDSSLSDLSIEDTNIRTGYTEGLVDFLDVSYTSHTGRMPLTSYEDSIVTPFSSPPSTSLTESSLTVSNSSETAVLNPTTVTEKDFSIKSTSSPKTSNNHLCGCRCLIKNITSSEITLILEKIVKKLVVPKGNLSAIRRKLSSAHDERSSSHGIGSGMVFVAVLPFILIILADIQKIYVLWNGTK